MSRLIILTMALRPEGVRRLVASVAQAVPASPWPIEHRIVWHHGAPDESRVTVAARISQALFELPLDSWVLAVDDDNLLHPELPARLAAQVALTPQVAAVAFGQARLDYGGYLPPLLPPTPGRIDGGQVALQARYAALEAWHSGDLGDGQYLAALYAVAPHRWATIPDMLTYHNAQRWAA